MLPPCHPIHALSHTLSTHSHTLTLSHTLSTHSHSLHTQAGSKEAGHSEELHAIARKESSLLTTYWSR